MHSEAMIKDRTSNIIKLDGSLNKKAKIDSAVAQAWKKIAPWWPLKNLIAANPLQGFEDLPFEQATDEAAKYFQSQTMPIKLDDINRQTIKWCQLFFDEGQATIDMPGKEAGLFCAWRKLMVHDKQLHHQNHEIIRFLKNLPLHAENIIVECLNKLHIHDAEAGEFLTLLLTTLPGWAGYIKYQNEWTQHYITHKNTISQTEYLAMRIVITCALWPEAVLLLDHYKQHKISNATFDYNRLVKHEETYRHRLLETLKIETDRFDIKNTEIPDAQLVFCIDVRSEGIRRALESEGKYDTYGFAGFFGIPAIIHNTETAESYASCPVLLSPIHTINATPCCDHGKYTSTSIAKKIARQSQKLYQSAKYTFTTPFILAEALGPWSGIWMTLRTLLPVVFKKTTSILNFTKSTHLSSDLNLFLDSHNNGISINDQCAYAENALRMIGLTNHFAKLVVFCGHGSTTENNAYATALDCGACGGHDGAANAKILANILNNPQVRLRLKNNGILIPNDTQFIAALHNTTTDAIDLLDSKTNSQDNILSNLAIALKRAQNKNSQARLKTLTQSNTAHSANETFKRSVDWAQTRPEWGLARNAAFIIGPRGITKHINLEGRAFLHSYDWQQDGNGNSLTTILTAPMVVAQWINCQYLFSTLDNAAFGSGSKVTHNLVGKIGIMQGNASDLMSGLPLQSIMQSDDQAYHEPQRLLTIVYAPKIMVSECINQQQVLQKLFANGWVLLICIDPTDGIAYELQRNLGWKHIVLTHSNINEVK